MTAHILEIGKERLREVEKAAQSMLLLSGRSSGLRPETSVSLSPGDTQTPALYLVPVAAAAHRHKLSSLMMP